ncbi:hypothetical protein EIN_370320 [Entamoeba invadens IP1]|uniref:C2 NT-type domain-containing protein n=1 Tax=Entamoeba invadens IP1 TaxID=370355 RepID=A0A0A1UBV5_ENTIV|nr:hypothetical protein EIN_370320 [Entamoeba invadens IP1]ELP92680.1 hypothetical protein EIN_370320 [Entamoeba invadens IP1]|eukprot:XP_004259451.1 hypothetical protein EIN_370320 [Entamoeba invadens IP1]
MFSRKRNTKVFTFTVEIREITGLDKVNNRVVFMKWWRGSKKKSGTLKMVLVNEGCANINSRFVFDTRLLQNGDSFKKKELILSLVASQCKIAKEEVIARVRINLAEYCRFEEKLFKCNFDDGPLRYSEAIISIFCAEKNSSVSSPYSIVVSEGASAAIEKRIGTSHVSMQSETSQETSFREDTNSIGELMRRLDDLKDQFEANEKALDELDQQITTLKVEKDELEKEGPSVTNSEFQSQADYLFLIDGVMLNNDMSFDGNNSTMSNIICSHIENDELFIEPDLHVLARLFEIINGIIHLSGGCPKRLCFWLSTVLRVYAWTCMSKTRLTMDQTIFDKFRAIMEKCVSGILTALTDFSNAKTTLFEDLFFNVKSKNKSEAVLNPVTTVLKCMKEMKVDELFVKEYVNLFFSFLDKQLFVYLLRTCPKITQDMVMNVVIKMEETNRLILGSNDMKRFEYVSKVVKIIPLNIDSFQPAELFAQGNPLILPHSMVDLVKKIYPQPKKATMTKLVAALPPVRKVTVVDPYAQVSLGTAIFQNFIFKQN